MPRESVFRTHCFSLSVDVAMASDSAVAAEAACVEAETPDAAALGRLRAKHREKVEDPGQAAMPTLLKRFRIS